MTPGLTDNPLTIVLFLFRIENYPQRQICQVPNFDNSPYYN